MASPTIVDMASRTTAMADKPKKKWVQKAINPAHKGQLKAKAEAAGETTREFASEHAGDSGKTGKQARLAETLMGMHDRRKSKLYTRKKG